jgi:hypothetical protein
MRFASNVRTNVFDSFATANAAVHMKSALANAALPPLTTRR